MEARHEQRHFELSTEQVEEIRHDRPEAVVDSGAALVVLQSRNEGPGILHWSAGSPEALAAAVATLGRQLPRDAASEWKITLINQAAYVDVLLRLDFQLSSHYLDHWLGDLPSFDPARESAVSIREAHKIEAEQLAGISKSCASDTGWLVNPAKWYRDWLASSANTVFIAEKRGLLAGLCSVRLYGDQDDKLWIRELAVHPDCRCEGLGRSLLETGLRWGQDRGAAKAFLAVDARNVGARRLYESVGFLPNGEEEFNLILHR